MFCDTRLSKELSNVHVKYCSQSVLPTAGLYLCIIIVPTPILGDLLGPRVVGALPEGGGGNFLRAVTVTANGGGKYGWNKG